MKKRTKYLWIGFVVSICISLRAMAQQFSDYPNSLGMTGVYYTWVQDPKDSTSFKAVKNYSESFVIDLHHNTNIVGQDIGETAVGNTSIIGQFDFSARAAYQWDFSGIKKANPIVTGVRLEIWYLCPGVNGGMSGGSTVDVKPLMTYQYNAGAQDRWTYIKNATKYTSFIDQTNQYPPSQYFHVDLPSTNQIYQDITQAIQAGTVFSIALMVEGDESWPNITTVGTGSMQVIQNGSGYQGIKLTVNYKVPINVTVQNGTPGNGDTVIVDGTFCTSPHSFNWLSGDQHKLLAKTVKTGSTIYSPIGWTDKTANVPICNTTSAIVNPMKNTIYEANFSITGVADTITQKFSSGALTPVGIDSWDGNFTFISKPNPWIALFNFGTNYCLRGYQDTLSGEKYNNWNNLSDVTNHHIFSITPNSPASLVSQLQPTTQGSIIKIDLLDAPGNYSGTVQFKDPWLIDSIDASKNNNKLNRGMNAMFKSRTAPFSPNIGTPYGGDVYQGVFLNQNPTFRPDLPNYSVSAPQTQTLGSFTGIFSNWSAVSTDAGFQDSTSLQTGVVFKQASAAVAAKYKGHLISSTLQATSGTNIGRKVASDINGITLHAVYCSAGSIWYTRQNTDGSWTTEVKLGDGRNPSIAVTNFYQIHVVWENYSGTNQSRVYYCRSTDGGVTWGTTKGFTGLEINGTYDATPVVFGNSSAMVVWRYGQAGNGGLYAVLEPNGINLQAQVVNDFNAQLPSGVEVGYQNTNPPPPNLYHLVYEDGSGRIIHNLLYVPSAIVVNKIDTLSLSPSLTSGNINPAIANDQLTAYPASTVAVVWENSTNHRIYYRESINDGNNWGAVKEFTHNSDVLSQPTVTVGMGANLNDVSFVLFQCGNQIGRTAKQSGSTAVWSPIICIGKGSGVQLPSYLCLDSAEIGALWTNGITAPYQISLNLINASKQMSGTISSDTTWSGIINVTETITVNAGITLTIAPSSSIEFSSGTSLVVNGTLNAQGDSDSSRILFTSASAATPGSWNYVQVNSGNSIFKYCTFEYGTYGLYLLNASSGSPVDIENCIFQNNSNYGLKIYGSNTKVKSCEMKNNILDGVICSLNPDIKFIGNFIHNNSLYGVYSMSGNFLEFYGNVIKYNGSNGLYTGGVNTIHLGQPYSWQGYNTISGNTGDEVSVGSGGSNLSVLMAMCSVHDSSGYDVCNNTSNPAVST